MMKTYEFGELLEHARPMLDEELQKYAPEHPEFCLLSPDVGRAGMPVFMNKCADQMFNMGIAEQSTVNVAAGMALEGRKPVIYGMSTFMSMRSCEQIRTNVCYQNAKVVILGNNTGLSQGPCGSTHYAMEDLAIVRTFPKMTLICPGDPAQTLKAFHAAMEHDGPVYIRMGNGRNESAVYKEEYEYQIGKGIRITDGKDASIVACGVMVAYAVEAAKQLEKEGIHVTVVDMHTIKPLDKELVEELARESGKIVTVEDHNIIGGLGGAVCETVAESGIPCKVKRLGIPDMFPGFGSFNDQMSHLGYGIDAMKDAIKAML